MEDRYGLELEKTRIDCARDREGRQVGRFDLGSFSHVGGDFRTPVSGSV
jgi:hypothetical protein